MSATGFPRATLSTFALLGVLAAVAFGLAFYRATDWLAAFPHDATGLVVGRDFLNFWMAGHAAHGADPGRYYDLHAYNQALAAIVGAGYPAQTWSYPPTQLLIAAPFALLPYRLALLTWTALGAAALYGALRPVLGRTAVYALAAPATLFAVMSGQSSLITTALIFAALPQLDRRPILTGLLLGLLSLKPQVALLIPVALIAGRHWRCLAAAAVTALGLIAATIALYRSDVWRDYFTFGLPAQNAVLAHTEIIATQSMPTVFMNLHRAGLGYGAAMAVQVAFALVATVAVFWAWRRPGDLPLKIAILLAASVAATPYLMIYDTLPLAVAGLWLLVQSADTPKKAVVVKMIWWLPFLQAAFGAAAIPGPALIAPLLLGWSTRRLAEQSGRDCG